MTLRYAVVAIMQAALWEHLAVEQHLKLVLASQKLPHRERQNRINRMLHRLEQLTINLQHAFWLRRRLVAQPAEN